MMEESLAKQLQTQAAEKRVSSETRQDGFANCPIVSAASPTPHEASDRPMTLGATHWTKFAATLATGIHTPSLVYGDDL
jgi:hypothetical protein